MNKKDIVYIIALLITTPINLLLKMKELSTFALIAGSIIITIFILCIIFLIFSLYYQNMIDNLKIQYQNIIDNLIKHNTLIKDDFDKLNKSQTSLINQERLNNKDIKNAYTDKPNKNESEIN
jgi:predicted PurR-regulated permease PerM